MVLPVPGEYDGTDGREISIGFLNQRARDTGDVTWHNYLRLAVPYLRALDVFADDPERAEDPGDRRRAQQAGHLRLHRRRHRPRTDRRRRVHGKRVRLLQPRSGAASRDLPASSRSASCRREVLYLGATNEDGYEMFNINRIQSRMTRPWTIQYIPNYRHSDQSEKHFLDWQMWVAHVFEGRPLTRIADLSDEETAEGTRLPRADRLAQHDHPGQGLVRATATTFPYWRDLVWYPEFMAHKGGGVWEGYVTGRLPDAWLVEVKDIAGGAAGYLEHAASGHHAQADQGADLAGFAFPIVGAKEAPEPGAVSPPPGQSINKSTNHQIHQSTVHSCSMPIRILITGGTFDKEYDEIRARLSFSESHLPEMLRLGRCRLDANVRTIMMVDSLDMSEADREAIAQNCRQCDETRIVITHGTDTMVETAGVLAARVEGKTIVLTGAMIPYAFGSSDGMFNLGSALSFVQVLPPGVYVAMNGKYFPWDRVRKNRQTGVFEDGE